jgi:hypothetical protein
MQSLTRKIVNAKWIRQNMKNVVHGFTKPVFRDQASIITSDSYRTPKRRLLWLSRQQCYITSSETSPANHSSADCHNMSTDYALNLLPMWHVMPRQRPVYGPDMKCEGSSSLQIPKQSGSACPMIRPRDYSRNELQKRYQGIFVRVDRNNCFLKLNVGDFGLQMREWCMSIPWYYEYDEYHSVRDPSV